MEENNLFEKIVNSYKSTSSVKDTAEILGVSKNTVQRVLITEGLWESKRSREVVELFNKGYSPQEIADSLMLSLKCVQNYLPYTKGMNNGSITVNAKNSKEKRMRMKNAFEKQKNKYPDQTNEVGAFIDRNLFIQQDERKKMEFMEIGKRIEKQERPSKAAKKYLPAVFKLHFELVDYNGSSFKFKTEEELILAKYAKVSESISRDVLVPASMSLNALNYMIQKLFGWQNSHLHEFGLDIDTFRRVTNGGNLNQWKKMCGVLFRFPDEDFADKYCGDDYDGTKSFKSWLKSKYCGSELPFSVGDTYIENIRLVSEFEKSVKDIKVLKDLETVDEIQKKCIFNGDCNSLLERLSLEDILFPEGFGVDYSQWLKITESEIREKKAIIDEMQQVKEEYLDLLDSLSELRRRRITQAEFERIINHGVRLSHKPKTTTERAYIENSKAINVMEERCHEILTSLEPQITPFANNLFYRYDFGDGWCVKITCQKAYYINDSWDFPNEQGYIFPVINDKDIVEDWDFYDFATDKKIVGNKADVLREIARKKTPICIRVDGLSVLDDVGGIYGFIDMLKTIHGNDFEKADEMREWAKTQGWTGRATKPINML